MVSLFIPGYFAKWAYSCPGFLVCETRTGSLNLYAVQLKECPPGADDEDATVTEDAEQSGATDSASRRDNVNVMTHGPRLGTEFLLDMEYYSGAAVVQDAITEHELRWVVSCRSAGQQAPVIMQLPTSHSGTTNGDVTSCE